LVAARSNAYARAFLALLAGFTGGALFAEIGVPLPWMLGSLAASAIVAILNLDWVLPAFSRQIAVPIVGVMAGSAFTLSVAQSMLEWWTVIPVLIAFLAAITFVGRIFFVRVCRLDATTAFFASVPAGMAELTPLAILLGANARALILIHSMRIIAVAFLVPFTVLLFVDHSSVAVSPVSAQASLSGTDWFVLAACAVGGYGIGRPLSRAGGLLTGPLLLSAIVHLTGVTDLMPPYWLLALMQVVIGTVIGSRFAGTRWAEAWVIMIQGFAWSAFVLLTAIATATVCSIVIDAPLAALVLAFAPGGFAEVTIVTYSLGIEVAFVVMCHVFRAISLVSCAPIIFHFLPKKPPTLPLP